MKLVGIEGAPIFGERTGIGQYSKRLLEAAAKQKSDYGFEIVKIWLPFKEFIPPLKTSGSLSYRLIKWFPPAVYFQFFKRVGWAPPYNWLALRKYKAFLFFNFAAFPISKGTKSVVSVHDLSFIRYGQYVSEKNRQYLEKIVPESIARANHILTISEFSKREIVDYYKVKPNKISVVTPAVDHDEYKPQSKSAVDNVKKKYGINNPYILSVCTLEPRKNLVAVLKAFNDLPEAVKKSHTLVLAGGKGWLDGEIQGLAEEISKTCEVVKTGYVPDEDLPALYSGAKVFMFVPFYEGFGMPVLEALACGAPVISSNNSSLPEVSGNSAIMVDAKKQPEISQALNKLLDDEKLRTKLSQDGLKQAQNFSWDKSAQKLIEMLDSL